jgi:hypothetical protein
MKRIGRIVEDIGLIFWGTAMAEHLWRFYIASVVFAIVGALMQGTI